MEFLMTYGWAILVVLAAIGALAYFGILSPDKFLPSSCTVSGGFSCGEFKVNTTHARFVIMNNLGVDANSVAVNLTPTTSGCVVDGGVVGATGLGNGEKINGGLLSFPYSGCTLSVGDKFKGNIKVTYVKSGETLSHEATGTLQTKVE